VALAGRLYLAVALGSALGAVARYLCSAALIALMGEGFPWGTLAVNVLGSFLIGFYATLVAAAGGGRANPVRTQFVIAGFCGGFTTFSIFSLETLLLLERQDFQLAALNVSLSIVLWLLAVWAGVWAATRSGWRMTG